MTATVRRLGHHRPRARWRTVARAAVAIGLLPAAALALSDLAPAPAGAAAASGWNIVTSPGQSTTANNLFLGSTCANAYQCWAVGASFPQNGAPSALINEWNGWAWTATPAPAAPGSGGYGLLDVSCVNGADCWAVGLATGTGDNSLGVLTMHWDGSAWAVVPSPIPAGAVGGVLEGVSCATATNCWAVGFTTDDTGAALNSLVEHWSGSAWTIVPAEPSGQTYDQLDRVTCVTATDCWAVGAAGPVQQNPNFLPIWPAAAGDQGLIEHWDGSAWSVVPSSAAPAPRGGYLTDVTCVTGSDCWASGSTTTAGGQVDAPLLQHWDGSAWTVVPAPLPTGTGAGIIDSVTCLDATRCWAAGTSGSFGGGGGAQFQPDAFIENFDGSAWSVQPSPNVTAFSFLNSITCLRGSSCWAVGGALTIVQLGSEQFAPLVEQMVLPPPSNQGLDMVARDGGVFAFGTAPFSGSMGGTALDAPVVGMALTPDGGGYWLVASDGGVFAFGDAAFYGSLGGVKLGAPVVGMALTPDGGGYWLVASDGGVFAFGDATFYGSMGGVSLHAPVVAMAATTDGGGYWLAASDGGVFSFGDATFYGSMGATALSRPIVAMATTPDAGGYWLVGADGGVFTFGDAPYLGSVPGQGIDPPAAIAGVTGTPDGGGYWLVGTDGSLYAYGDAAFLGSLGGLGLAAPVSGLAST